MSLATIVFVGGVVAGATGAFFSDTVQSTGNVFTAGSVKVALTNIVHAYGYGDGTSPTGYFNTITDPNEQGVVAIAFNDLKPTDKGMLTYSLINDDNDAYLCARVDVDGFGDITDPDDPVAVFLKNFTMFSGPQGTQPIINVGVWHPVNEDSIGDTAQVMQSGDEWDLFIDYCFGDWGPGTYGPGTTGVDGTQLTQWLVDCNSNPLVDYNPAQGAEFTATISLYAVQARNNDGFSCDSLAAPSFVQP